MHHTKGLNRRELLAGAAALGAIGSNLIGTKLIGGAQAQQPAPSLAATSLPAASLPARGVYLIRNAHVMTMEPGTGDIPGGDVHVRDGAIVAVGKNLDAPGAAVIDGDGMIVLPGLVETHWHMWNTLLRSMSGEKPEHGYFRTVGMLGRVYTADDMYQGTRLSAAEAVNSGMTFVHSWCHNIRSPEYAEADIRALCESGLRARFSYGWMQGHKNEETIDLADLERLKRDWSKYSNDGLIHLGMAWRGQGGNNPATAVPAEIYTKEVEAARRLGLPITVHASGSRPVIGQVDRIGKANLLAKDIQVIHANMATKEEIAALKAAGASVSLSPFSELRIGFGMPQTGTLIAAGIPIGLSIDTTVLSGNADMFAIMKATQNIENGLSENEFKLTARRTLELATLEGARSMGVDDQIGSLKPGKRADLILVSTRDVNMGVFTDPAHMLVTAAQPSNVDTVMVDGRILKRNGKLTAVDTRAIVADAGTALAGIRKRGNWW
jgi:5-methylthioadenosine/S-adenosylhomocysteine deaminase